MRDRGTFERALDAWLAEVRREALKLFDEGVPMDRAINCAIPLVEAKAAGAAARARAFGVSVTRPHG